jgi:hypothetical protein
MAETTVLVLVIVLVVMALALAVLLWVGTAWFQNLIYSEPAENLHLGAPVAALALTGYLALWCFLEYRAASRGEPGRHGSLFEFPAYEVQEFQKIWAVKGRLVPAEEGKNPGDKDFDQNWILRDPREIVYESRRTGPFGQSQYQDMNGRSFARSDADGMVVVLTVHENDNPQNPPIVFQAEVTRDVSGQPIFKVDPNQSSPRYVEVGGRRVMTEDSLGRLRTFRWGLFFTNLLLNSAHLALWFVCLWLLLRFQWSHALGLAFIFWLLMSFAILPMLLERADEAGQERAARTENPAR